MPAFSASDGVYVKVFHLLILFNRDLFGFLPRTAELITVMPFFPRESMILERQLKLE